MTDFESIFTNLAVATGTVIPPYYVYNNLIENENVEDKKITDEWSKGKALAASVFVSFFSYTASKLTIKELKKLFDELMSKDTKKERCKERRRSKKKKHSKKHGHKH